MFLLIMIRLRFRPCLEHPSRFSYFIAWIGLFQWVFNFLGSRYSGKAEKYWWLKLKGALKILYNQDYLFPLEQRRPTFGSETFFVRPKLSSESKKLSLFWPSSDHFGKKWSKLWEKSWTVAQRSTLVGRPCLRVSCSQIKSNY